MAGRLLTEWRIQKRVEEQFNSFIDGFNELIPPDLVNVFDERELELLIGGIADIDVDDWKKHTDYRGYTESDEVIVNFWKVRKSRCSVYELSNAHHRDSAFELGTRNKSRGCFNLQPVPRGYPSTGSRISKGATGLGDLPSKRPGR